MTTTAATETEPKEKLSRDKVQVAATSFLSLFAIVGIALYGLPFYYDFMVKEFGWNRATVTSGNTYSKLIVGPAFGFIAGWMVDRFGPRKLMLAGILLAGTALIGLGNITGALWMFYFFYLFNALGYVFAGPLPNQVLLTRWFDKSRGKAMGFAYLGIGIAGGIVPLLSAWLASRFSWHTALTILGILMIVIAFPLAFFVKDSPDDIRAKNMPRPPAAPIGWAFRSRAFYLLAIGSMCSIGAVGGTYQNLKLYMTLDLFKGMDSLTAQKTAAFVLSLILFSSVVGRLLMGYLADRFAKKRIMLLIYMIVALAIPLLFISETPGVIYLFAILFGIGLGGDYMIIPLMAAELFGVKVMGRVMGLVLTADGVAEAVAPMVVATLRDTTQSYSVGFGVLIALALTGAVAISLLPRHAVTDQP